MSDRYEGLDLSLGREARDHDLDPIPREMVREGQAVSFFGYDLWNAYEVSFLLPSGKPVVYHMQALYEANSPAMVESKSFKLFLNAQNNRVFSDLESFEEMVRGALSETVGAEVRLSFTGPEHFSPPMHLPGQSLDASTPSRLEDRLSADLLATEDSEEPFAFHSHLLRSSCPVTGQPDWGAVLIRGRGRKRPEATSLLAYLLSYRNHGDFHEACCERIYGDLFALLGPDILDVACFYTRRGGLDINPHRSSEARFDTFTRPVWRQ